jgi:hypothetical protein
VLVAGKHTKQLVTWATGTRTPSHRGRRGRSVRSFFPERRPRVRRGPRRWAGPDTVRPGQQTPLQTAGPGRCVAGGASGLVSLKPWTQVGETGSVTVTGQSRLPLEGSYKDPVVLTAGSAGEPALRPTDTDGVELRGGRFGDEVHYAVLERGRHTLDGSTAVEAGLTTTTSDWQTVTFAEPFDSPPVVIADVQTTGPRVRSGRTPVRRSARRSTAVAGRPRIRNVTSMGFDLRPDGSAAVGFAAVERGEISAHGRTGATGVGDDALRSSTGRCSRQHRPRMTQVATSRWRARAHCVRVTRRLSPPLTRSDWSARSGSAVSRGPT